MALSPTASLAECPPLPLDIVVAVDTSGSMDDEMAEVEANLNWFIVGLATVGWDPRLILIAEDSLCVPAPLGSGLCTNDEQLPGYRHVVDTVGSNDALQKILDHYDDYSSSLRPGSKRSVIVVSDDESDLSAGAFVSALLAADAGFGSFQAHAIAASVDAFVPPLPNVCTTFGAAEGAVYKSLVAMSGGVFYDLCLQDFDPGFLAIATSTGAPVFCDGFESGDASAWAPP
jgi:hypothetical protein